MTRIISIQDLPVEARELLEQIGTGDEILIEQGGQAIARITPVAPKRLAGGSRKLGALQGKIWISPDFDTELPSDFWCPPADPLTK